MKDIDDRELDDAMKAVRGTWRPWLLLFLTIGIGGYGGWQLWQRTTKAESAVSEIDARIAEKVSQNAVLEQNKAELGQRIERLERESRALIEQKKIDDRKRQEHSVRFAKLKDQLAQKLAAQVGSGAVQFNLADGLAISLADKALFDGANASISKPGQELLAGIGSVVTSTKGLALEVDAEAESWEASSARAAAVAHFLETAKVPKLRAIGHSAAKQKKVAIAIEIE